MSEAATGQLKDLREKIKDVKFGMFTTLDPDTKLSSRPMTSQQLDDSLYVSVAGHAELTRDRAKIDELWSPLVAAWFDGGKEDPHLSLIKVHIGSAEYWDTHSSKMTQLYALAKSALTGKAPRDIGEHKKINL